LEEFTKRTVVNFNSVHISSCTLTTEIFLLMTCTLRYTWNKFISVVLRTCFFQLHIPTSAITISWRKTAHHHRILRVKLRMRGNFKLHLISAKL